MEAFEALGMSRRGTDHIEDEDISGIMDAAFPPASETFIMKVEGHDIYQDDNGNVLVMLKDSNNLLVPVTDSDGIAFTDPTALPGNTNDWFTPGTSDDFVQISLDVIEESEVVVDQTPDWGQLLPKDDKPLFQDNNTDSFTSNLVGTDVGSDGNSVIVVITNITGGTYSDPTQLPGSSSEWYTENPDDLGTYIQIQFGTSGGDDFVMPAEGEAMVQLIDSIYDGMQQDQLDNLPAYASVFETAAIDGDGGSIPGLAAITGKDVNEDLDGDDTNGIQSIQSVVTQEVSEAITQLTDPGNQKTADEIFSEAIEDTLIELESYDPDIFGA
jgi:hypothetical protein